MGRFSEIDIMLQEGDWSGMTPAEAQAMAAGLVAGEREPLRITCPECHGEGGEPAPGELYRPCSTCEDEGMILAEDYPDLDGGG